MCPWGQKWKPRVSLGTKMEGGKEVATNIIVSGYLHFHGNECAQLMLRNNSCNTKAGVKVEM